MAGAHVGVDVGTQSARAGVFDSSGKMLATASVPLVTGSPEPDHFEQCSVQVWEAVCKAVQTALQNSGVQRDNVKSIGFEATCSLAVIGEGPPGKSSPVSVTRPSKVPSPSPPSPPTVGGAPFDIILWMDHRATEQAKKINATEHPVLDFVGGGVSPEMDIPKILWLEECLPSALLPGVRLFSLPDFLCWRATGTDMRSSCCLTCKFNWLHPHCAALYPTKKLVPGFQPDYLETIGISKTVREDLIRAPVGDPGTPVGAGLSSEAAVELGLPVGLPVAAGMIDAHAGGLGTLMAKPPQASALVSTEASKRCCLIAGTSMCVMMTSANAVPIPGLWGPYFSAMVPRMWLTESGLTTTGAFVDVVLRSHLAYPQALREAGAELNTTCVPPASVHSLLVATVEGLAKTKKTMSGGAAYGLGLTETLHTTTDVHGNRSPYGDAEMRQVLAGGALDATVEGLARAYLSALQAVGYALLDILKRAESNGHPPIEVLSMCGGLTANPLFVQCVADVTQRPVLVVKDADAALLGAAMCGAAAASCVDSKTNCTQADGASALSRLIVEMAQEAELVQPDRSGVCVDFHTRKFKVYSLLLQTGWEARRLMEERDASG